MKGALLEDLKTTAIIVGVLAVAGVIFGVFYAIHADNKRSEMFKEGALNDCPADRTRMVCARRVEEKHDDCFDAAKAEGGLDVRAYRRCVGVPFVYRKVNMGEMLDSIVPGKR